MDGSMTDGWSDGVSWLVGERDPSIERGCLSLRVLECAWLVHARSIEGSWSTYIRTCGLVGWTDGRTRCRWRDLDLIVDGWREQRSDRGERERSTSSIQAAGRCSPHHRYRSVTVGTARRIGCGDRWRRAPRDGTVGARLVWWWLPPASRVLERPVLASLGESWGT